MTEQIPEYQMLSDGFYCSPCYRETKQLIKGIKRYDSLVVCEKHVARTEEILGQLRTILDQAGATVITDLGL